MSAVASSMRSASSRSMVCMCVSYPALHGAIVRFCGWCGWCGQGAETPARLRLPDLVEPGDLGGLAGVAEGLEFVIPRLPEGEAEFAVQFEGVGAGDIHRVAQ